MLNPINWLLPQYCVCCGQKGRLLCLRCYRLIHFNCGPCTDLFSQKYLDQALSLAIYQPPISDLIKNLKYHRIKNIGKILAELLYFHLNLPQSDLIVWTPISQRRLNNRGFNQAQLIGENLGQLTHTPSVPLLIKTRHTAKQASSTFKQRLKNLDNSFGIDPHYQKLSKNKTIMLIDDVLSTGNTLNECARILKLAGANQVIGLAAARS